MPFQINQPGWAELAKQITKEHLEPRMERVAQACNDADGIDGYRTGTEGDGPQLEKHDYRATVIAATAEAQVLNGERNTLERNFYLAFGD